MLTIRARHVAIAASAVVLAASVFDAHAATSPFGIATPDTSGSYFGGPFGSFFAWIAVHQAHFYKALTGALGRLKDDSAGLWLLFGLSFAYGVFHAVGPGHGKAVITSYLVASGERARRGVLLSFLAAGVQAVSAIVIVALGAVVFRISAMAMTLATDWIEVVSYGAIAVFGAYLLWTKIRGIHAHSHVHPELNGFIAASCEAIPAPSVGSPAGHEGHDHAGRPAVRPSAATLRNYRKNRDLRRPLAGRAWAAVLAVGIRPCSGAIIILVFALSQGFFGVGMIATLVMALGTGFTVALLAVSAIGMKSLVFRLAGTGGSAVLARLARGVEIAGAAVVFLFGVILLGGSLYAAGGLPS